MDTSFFKAYDIRGLVDSQLTPEVAYKAGKAAAGIDDAKTWVIGRDMRPSSEPLARAFATGLAEAGRTAIDIGLASTDMLYFASGTLDMPGAMFTASHNPAQYNGIKLCRAGAAPISIDTGLGDIRDAVAADTATYDQSKAPELETRDMLSAFATHTMSFVDTAAFTDLTIAIDAGNGMGGHVVPPVFDQLPVTVDAMYFELDGMFPNHPADPIDPANLADLAARVVEKGYPLGLAFDGDADRMFAVDENGRPVPSSLIGAVVADVMLAKHEGATVLHNLICSRTVPETIQKAGGTAIETRVGHSFIKQKMAETGAVFACEHSGHYYFKENWRADSGMIAALVLLEAVMKAGVPLSEVLAPYDRYVMSGEINFRVEDIPMATKAIEAAATEAYPDAMVSHLDGMTIDIAELGWFNVRASNTEPLLRLNAEGRDVEAMKALRDLVAATVEALD